MAPSWIQLAIVAALLVLLFGRGRISELMSDVGKGIRSFKKGISEEDDVPTKITAPEATSQNENPAAEEKTSAKTHKAV